MDNTEILIRILITVIFGAILGLETETRANEEVKKEKDILGGLRTYTLICLTGGITGVIYLRGENVLTYLAFAGLLVLVASAYILNVQFKKAFGLTTEIAILVTFLLGFLTTSKLVPLQTILFVLVIMAFFLSQKRGFGYIINKIQHTEVIDLLKFGLIAAVILPLLPDQNFLVKDFTKFFSEVNIVLNSSFANITIINPFRIWLIVVLISGLNLLAYFFSKLIGDKKGVLLTAFIGGIISSTSTTISLAHKSKNANDTDSKLYASAAVISNSISFITISTLFLIFAPEILPRLALVMAAIFLIGICYGFFLIYRNKDKGRKVKLEQSFFSIGPAIRFVSIIIFITFLIQVLQLFDSKLLTIVATATTGFAGMDASVIAISQLFNNIALPLNLAVVVFLLANTVNYFAKIAFSLMNGSSTFNKYLISGLVLTLLSYILVFI